MFSISRVKECAAASTSVSPIAAVDGPGSHLLEAETVGEYLKSRDSIEQEIQFLISFSWQPCRWSTSAQQVQDSPTKNDG